MAAIQETSESTREMTQLRELHAMAEAVSQTRDLEEIYQVAMKSLRRILKADRVAVLLIDSDQVMRFKAWTGLSEAYRKVVEGHSPWKPDDPDPQPVLVEDIRNDAALADFRELVLGEGISSLNFIPLVFDGVLLGKLMLYYDEPYSFTPNDGEVARSCARQIAAAIDRQRAQDALLQSQVRLERALEAGSMGTWDYDMLSGKVVWSPQVEVIHGIPPGSFDGTFEAYTRDIHPDDYERVVQAIQSSAHEGGPHDVEYRLARPDGSVVWVHGKGDVVRDEAGNVVGMAGICMDVTERKQRDLLLRGQKEAKELIIRGAPLDDVLHCLVRLVETQYEQPARAAIWLLSEDQQSLKLGAAPSLPAELAHAILEGGESSCAEALISRGPEFVRNISQDPRWKGLAPLAEKAGVRACWSLPFKARDGRILGILARYHSQAKIATDHDFQVMEVLSQTAAIAIERVETDESLMKAKEEADAANEAKSRFLANVSHEIRTPMTGITGAVGLLMGSVVSPQQSALLSMIKSCSDVLVTVINDVLDLSKIEAGELRLDNKPFDPVAVVEECVSLMKEPAAAAGLSLTLSRSGIFPESVLGDSVRLRQVVLNLLNNAVKFTETGDIKVRLGIVESQEEVVRIRVEVEDTGIGISASALKELFRPFRQVDEAASRRFGGSGLGLSISRQLVGLMNGEIGVESEVGKGSTFWFHVAFPLVETIRDSGETLKPERETECKSPSQVRLLLAEDNPINRRVLLLQLQQLGYEAEEAGDGLEALQKLKEGDFDLVLMDCQMPHMDGYEVTRRLRAESIPKQPIIVALTAHALEGERDKCLSAGMNGYLRKPISADKLRRTLQELL